MNEILFYVYVVVSSLYTISVLSNDTNDSNTIKMFQQLFVQRRAQHKEAVNTIKNLNHEQQAKMINIVAENAFKVLGSSQAKLRDGGYIPGMEFPEDQTLLEALSQTLENTAFFSEIVLHFPSITKKKLRENKSWELLLTWGIFFTSESKFLDKNTKKLIHLVTQELDLAERDPDFVNPYATSKARPALNVKPQAIKKKKSFKKGPQLSRQFGDL